MIQHRFFTKVFLLALASVPAFSQDVGVLHLRPLHIEMPASWRFDGSRQPIEGRGPNGEKVLISIMRRRNDDTSKESSSAKDIADGFASGPMKEMAVKDGLKIVRPVEVFPTVEGKAAYAAASEEKGFFGKKSYFIQYLFAAPGVIIYFTFEGKGEAVPAMQRFDEFFKTQQWDAQ